MANEIEILACVSARNYLFYEVKADYLVNKMEEAEWI